MITNNNWNQQEHINKDKINFIRYL